MSIVSVFSVSGASSAVSMTSVTGLSIGGGIATIFLIFLLSSKEIILTSSYWNNKVMNAFNTVTIPLLIVFFAIVVFKIKEIL
jgi:hypothetical protein